MTDRLGLPQPRRAESLALAAATTARIEVRQSRRSRKEQHVTEASSEVDLEAAERFILANARLLDRHRLACLLHGAPAEPVVAALGAYRNADGGFGHALEPDIRAPTSEPSATMHA